MTAIKSISSRQNEWYKRFRDALRERGEELVLEGRKPVADALAAGWKPIAIGVRDAVDAPDGSRTIHFSGGLLDSLADARTSQGILGLFERPRTSAEQLFARRDTIVVALDGVQDPGNVGTIVRLAAAFDAAGVALLPGCADPFSPKAIRASVGAILNVPVAQMTIGALLASGLPLFAADGAGVAVDPPSRGAVLVFGNEGAGVSDAIRERATPIAIAMSSRVESLNVAASAAILLARSYSSRR